MKETSKTKVYSALEVANICGVVNQTVINWIKKGYLSAFSTPGNQYRIYQDDLIEFMKSKNMRIPSEIAGSAVKKHSKNAPILVIEDSKGLNLVFSKFLERNFEGKTIISAFDGIQAGIELAKKQAGVVLLDLDFSGIDTVDLCKKLLESDDFGKPDVIAVSSEKSESEIEKIKALGVSAILQKPIDMDEFKACFEKVL